MECSISLNRAGIPTDRLPLKYDGTIKTEDHLQWIAIQEAKESALQQKRTFDVVECPMNMDILSGTLNIPTVTLDLTYVFDCCLFLSGKEAAAAAVHVLYHFRRCISYTVFVQQDYRYPRRSHHLLFSPFHSIFRFCRHYCLTQTIKQIQKQRERTVGTKSSGECFLPY
jgi:hypothetical protein